MAAMLGIRLKKLSTRVEADINFSRVFGIGDQPVMEAVRVTLLVESDEDEEKIKEAEINKIPVIIIVGPKDLEANQVSIRTQKGEEKVALANLKEYIEKL